MSKLTICKFLVSLLFLMFIVDALEAQIFKIDKRYISSFKINCVKLESCNYNRNKEERYISLKEQYVFDSNARLIYSMFKTGVLTNHVFNTYEDHGIVKTTSTQINDFYVDCGMFRYDKPLVYKEKINKYGDIKSIKSSYEAIFRLFFLKGHQYYIPYRRIEKLKYIYDEKGLLISVLNKKQKIKYEISYEFFN